MNLPELCIRRPVFTWAMTLIIVIIGILGYERLAVRDLPDISTPIVIIQATYPGADAQLLETQVTSPIENAISGVNGIDYIKSDSSQGNCRIIVSLQVGYDVQTAIDDIRNKLSTVYPPLPTAVPPPTVMRGNDNDDPAIVLSVTSKTRNAMDVTDYVVRYIQPELQQIPNVSNAEIWGERDYAMRVMLNPLKMAAHGVTVTDINNALLAQNVYVPSGQIKSFSRYYPITTEANLNTADQFRNLILKSNNGYITRFGDVADINIGPEDTDSAFRINGKNAIALGVIPDSTANPIDVSDDVKSMLDKLQSNLPSDMQIAVLFDNSKFIAASLNEVYRAIVEALILVTLVIFLFLGSWRATLIPVITIPVCLIATFAILYGFSYSVNIITLLALVLAIGLVVDDAIVMLENIHRHIELGQTPFAAAITGSKEIVFAIIAMTLTLVAVYLPTGFTQGLTGILFSQFAVTLAGAVLISGFIALTLSPMMSSRILAAQHNEGRYSVWLEKNLGRLTEGYKRLLSYALYHRIWVVLMLLLFALLGYIMYRGMPSELAPVEDQDYIMGVITPPDQASFSYTDHYARMVQKIYEANPNITNSFMVVGDNGNASQVFSFAILKPQEDRKDTQQKISSQLQTEMNQVAGVEAFPVIPAPLGQHTSSHRSLEIVLMNPGTLPHLISVADQFAADISKYPGLTNVQNTTTLNSRLVDFKIKRDVAADLQINMKDITSTIATLYGGNSGNQHFEYDGQQYDVLVQLSDKDMKELSQINKIYVRSQTGQQIPLSSLVTVDAETGANDFPHYNRLRSASVSAELAPGYSMGQVITYLQYAGAHYLPGDTQYTFGGALKQFLRNQGSIAGIFIMALIFIYLVLAAQFESIIDPLVVLFSVPLSMLGGLILLKIAGGTLNIFSEIGMVTLIGLVSKHGILITEFINRQREKGLALHDAIVTAAGMRLRPILMTTGAMVLGAVPLAIASGAGSANRHQIGWVIVGGMLFGTFFSLFVVPVAYSFLSYFKKSN